jgi:hypothetical protein
MPSVDIVPAIFYAVLAALVMRATFTAITVMVVAETVAFAVILTMTTIITPIVAIVRRVDPDHRAISAIDYRSRGDICNRHADGDIEADAFVGRGGYCAYQHSGASDDSSSCNKERFFHDIAPFKWKNKAVLVFNNARAHRPACSIW